MRNRMWPFIVFMVIGTVACIFVIESGKAQATPDNAGKPWGVKIFKAAVDGNQNETLAKHVNAWLAFNDKTIEVVSITPAGCGGPVFALTITVVYRGAAQEPAKTNGKFESPVWPDLQKDK